MLQFHLIWSSFKGPLTNEAVMSINNFVNQREDLLATRVEDLEKSLLLYLCWTKLKNFCPLTGRLKKEEIILRGDSFLDRFEVQITFIIKSAIEILGYRAERTASAFVHESLTADPSRDHEGPRRKSQSIIRRKHFRAFTNLQSKMRNVQIRRNC